MRDLAAAFVDTAARAGHPLDVSVGSARHLDAAVAALLAGDLSAAQVGGVVRGAAAYLGEVVAGEGLGAWELVPGTEEPVLVMLPDREPALNLVTVVDRRIRGRSRSETLSDFLDRCLTGFTRPQAGGTAPARSRTGHARDRPRRVGRGMASRTTPPFRADHVGSLLRPPEVHQARADHAAGRIGDDELRAVEDDAIRQVVADQEGTGLRSATDGEFRRTSWHMDFIYQLHGIDRAEDQNLSVHFHNASGDLDFTSAALAVHDRVRLDRPIFADHFAFLQSVVSSATPKLTIPSPSMVHYRGGTAAVDRRVYPDLEEFWSDLAAAYSAEIRALAEQGCTYLQLDDTSLAYLNDPQQRAELTARGEDAESQHLRYIRTINAALAGKPEGLHVTTHLCRGNFRSSWAAEGSYDFVAEALFGDLAVDGFFLEYDDERSGDFSPLRYVPPGKAVVLGLVTTKRGQLEDAEVLKRRIDEASKHIDLDQLCLSPQCGFSSTVEGNELTREEQFAKLRLIVEVAADVWGE
jgi:5-methyltetrahydropteroyltriglutamate--homocysteine methyltransferase